MLNSDSVSSIPNEDAGAPLRARRALWDWAIPQRVSESQSHYQVPRDMPGWHVSGGLRALSEGE